MLKYESEKKGYTNFALRKQKITEWCNLLEKRNVFIATKCSICGKAESDTDFFCGEGAERNAIRYPVVYRTGKNVSIGQNNMALYPYVEEKQWQTLTKRERYGILTLLMAWTERGKAYFETSNLDVLQKKADDMRSFLIK